MAEFAGFFIAFLASLVALGGNARDESRPGLLKLTWVGKTAALLAVLGFAFSLRQAHEAAKDFDLQSEQLREAAIASEAARAEVAALRERAEDYRALLAQLVKESERQRQVVVDEYIILSPYGSWRGPNYLHSGSIVKFYGFHCDLQLLYRDHETVIPASAFGSVPEIALIGGAGEALSWRLKNLSNRRCDGKVYVESTPRSRSPFRSWREEAR